MRILVPISGIVAAALGLTGALAAEPPMTTGRPTMLERIAARREARRVDEKAIRQGVDAFVAHYNAHDAAAIAAAFAEDASIADANGHVTQGRKAIEATFAEVFKRHPNTTIENTIASIRFIRPTEAIETGSSTVVYDKDATAEKTRYQVTHKKIDGAWQMVSAVELPGDAWTGDEPLSHLDMLVGRWVDESPDAVVLTSYIWSENRRFLLSRFTIQIAGRPAMTGVQRIGWDPLEKTIRSWVFDSEGGFAEGVWTQDGDQWKVRLKGVTSDGKPATVTQLMTFEGDDRMTFQLVDRTLGDEKLPDGPKVVVVRQPELPAMK